MNLLTLKEQTIARCGEIIEARIQQQKDELNELQKAANDETKSSAGDKYETSRAMMHLEKEKMAAQLNANMKLHQVMSQITADLKKKAGLGSMIRTDQGIYFLSVSLGEQEINGEKVICLSPVSPLGNALQTSLVGKTITFNKREFKIMELV